MPPNPGMDATSSTHVSNASFMESFDSSRAPNCAARALPKVDLP
ncbi:hypothetical protein [Nonomuraea sp. bgisy101]